MAIRRMIANEFEGNTFINDSGRIYTIVALLHGTTDTLSDSSVNPTVNINAYNLADSDFDRITWENVWVHPRWIDAVPVFNRVLNGNPIYSQLPDFTGFRTYSYHAVMDPEFPAVNLLLRPFLSPADFDVDFLLDPNFPLGEFREYSRIFNTTNDVIPQYSAKQMLITGGTGNPLNFIPRIDFNLVKLYEEFMSQIFPLNSSFFPKVGSSHLILPNTILNAGNIEHIYRIYNGVTYKGSIPVTENNYSWASIEKAMPWNQNNFISLAEFYEDLGTAVKSKLPFNSKFQDFMYHNITPCLAEYQTEAGASAIYTGNQAIKFAAQNGFKVKQHIWGFFTTKTGWKIARTQNYDLKFIETTVPPCTHQLTGRTRIKGFEKLYETNPPPTTNYRISRVDIFNGGVQTNSYLSYATIPNAVNAPLLAYPSTLYPPDIIDEEEFDKPLIGSPISITSISTLYTWVNTTFSVNMAPHAVNHTCAIYPPPDLIPRVLIRLISYTPDVQIALVFTPFSGG
jgi:hypothetical protein